MTDNLRYKGFIESKELLKSGEIEAYTAYNPPQLPDSLSFYPSKDQKLGHYCEDLLAGALRENTNVSLRAQGLQIIEDGHTLGELDFLIEDAEGLRHIELAYKLYLQVKIGDQIHWLGPNARDRLALKMETLSKKQLALGMRTETELRLQNMGLPKIRSSHFILLGQLFTRPDEAVLDSKINPEAQVGYWYYLEELQAQFSTSKFFIPNKLDWLSPCITKVKWQSWSAAKALIAAQHERSFSPLVWIKQPKGNMQKAFVVWWNIKELNITL